jgi:uncharacterized protein (DUF1501 family)
MKSNFSRRQFIQLGTGAAIASSLLPLGRFGSAVASSATGYKALVCLMLNGGNDGHNWVVPVTTSAYGVYAKGRQSLALAQNSLLPLKGAAANGVTYGLHASCPDLQAMFNAGSAAFVSNVGPLIRPTTVAQARADSSPLPPQLFSHFDQVNEWQTAVPQAQTSLGWGGRIADLFLSQGMTSNLAFNIAVGGSSTWQQGQTTIPYTLGANGAAKLSVDNTPWFRNDLRAKATHDLITQGASDPNLMVDTYAGIYQNAAAKVTLVNGALSAAGDFTTVFPAAQANDWGLSQQLHEVARVIKAQAHIGDSRQLFFVQLGGFDTHSGQLATQSMLLGYISQYVNAFHKAMVEIGMQNDVTLFTMSEFGRTLASNGSGADHGWGNHHLVVGGGVLGGKFYGTMPDLTIGGANDVGQGRLLPSTSADQYAATLASWFGVADSELNPIFSNLPNFTVRNLGLFG